MVSSSQAYGGGPPSTAFSKQPAQPVGGMDMIARGFVREIGGLIRYNAKVTAIKQGDQHVTVTYVDARTGGAPMTATAVGWHRVPWALGCFGRWTDEARKQHYRNLCAIDERILLAGEHVSCLPAWQEGAVLSALDAISRLHRRVLAS
jgi:monoamine oxidase